MLESKLTLYLARYFLERDFRSKRDMAAKLHIPYRALLRLFQGQSTGHDTQRVMNGIAIYCIVAQIPLDELFREFSIFA